MSTPLSDLDTFLDEFAQNLASELSIPLRPVEEALAAVTQGWAVEIQHMRPVTNHHTQYVIHTPWQPVED